MRHLVYTRVWFILNQMVLLNIHKMINCTTSLPSCVIFNMYMCHYVC